jgi:hypothetical protein
VSEGLQDAMEAKLALTEVAFQSDDKLAAKNPPEHRDGKKEARVRWNPKRVIERQSAGGHHTMGMRVMFELAMVMDLRLGNEGLERESLGGLLRLVASLAGARFLPAWTLHYW